MGLLKATRGQQAKCLSDRFKQNAFSPGGSQQPQSDAAADDPFRPPDDQRASRQPEADEKRAHSSNSSTHLRPAVPTSDSWALLLPPSPRLFVPQVRRVSLSHRLYRLLFAIKGWGSLPISLHFKPSSPLQAWRLSAHSPELCHNRTEEGDPRLPSARQPMV